MWFRIALTSIALAIVLYIKFAFDFRSWIKNNSTPTGEASSPISESPASGQEIPSSRE